MPEPIIHDIKEYVESLDDYFDSDIDFRENVAYYGYIAPSGKWYIIKEIIIDAENMQYRYAKGDEWYSHNWNMREDLEYKHWGKV